MDYNYQKGATNCWGTPDGILERFAEYFDPCPFRPQFDGLAVDWKGNTFVNPPFSNMKRWADKAFAEYQKDPSRNIVFLMPSDRLNRKYLEKWWGHCSMTLVKGTVRFKPLLGQSARLGFHLPVVLLTLGRTGFDVIDV